VRGSQNGAAAGQSAPDTHCTQALLTGSHRGVAPAQSASVRHPTQMPAELRQTGVAVMPVQALMASSPQDPHTAD
jgi:hypothetical protein